MIREYQHLVQRGHWPNWGHHDGILFCWTCIKPPKPRRKPDPYTRRPVLA